LAECRKPQMTGRARIEGGKKKQESDCLVQKAGRDEES